MSAEKQNSYALTLEGDRLHISQAESGRKGYYCPACNQEMIAHKSRKIRSHFKHDFWDVEHKGKCTYSDETYRHKIGKEILQRIKKIKVPALYKYPPTGMDGRAQRIRQGETIRAHTVEIELPFYEDELGDIKWGRQDRVEEKYLLIQPDAAFFDKSGRPTLLIELVATHKPDGEKLAKLKRLGINTVLVRLPKGTEEEIEKAFAVSSSTKWAYHHEEQKTEYIPVPSEGQDDLSDADEEQRKLFEENFKCRASQVNNLLRTIGRCLESEQYQEIERRLRSDLSRTEAAARRATGEVQKLRHSIRTEAERSVGDRRRKIESRRESIDEQHHNLERRYTSKRKELNHNESAIREAQARVTEELEEIGQVPGTVEGRRKQIEERRKAIETRRGDIVAFSETEEIRRREISQKEDDFAERIEAEGIRLQLEHDKLKADQRERFEGLKGELTERIDGARAAKEELWSEEKGGFESIYAEESDVIRRALECIQRRADDRNIPFPERYHQLLEAGGILNDIQETHSRTKLIIAATESLDKKTYNSWYS